MIDVTETTPADRIARIRDGIRLPSDLAWLRAVPRTRRWPGENSDDLVCDCRCRCHRRGAPTATGAAPGSCGLLVNLETLDCGRGCRSSHILASECYLDELRDV